MFGLILTVAIAIQIVEQFSYSLDSDEIELFESESDTEEDEVESFDLLWVPSADFTELHAKSERQEIICVSKIWFSSEFHISVPLPPPEVI